MHLHSAAALVALAYSLWTLKLDFEVYYGWQKGGWKAKFTHWGFALNVLYLMLAALAALVHHPTPPLLATVKRRVLYLSATVTLHVDLSFLVLILPRRLLGLEKALQVMSASSVHKHVLNAMWVFGVAGLDPKRTPLDNDEFFVWGILVPLLFASLYLLFALFISNAKYAHTTLALSLIHI